MGHTLVDGPHDPCEEIYIASPSDIKVVDFIRHGEGFHNVAGNADPSAYRSWNFEDAHLTSKGWEQARQLGEELRSTAAYQAPDVVIVSPLTRALETAAGVYGIARWTADSTTKPLMLPQAESQTASEAHGISLDGVPPVVATELCREHLGLHPCDRRRPVEIIATRFPGVDFSQVASGEDTMWDSEVRETEASLQQRGRELIRYLVGRKERRIAVVAHGGILREALRHFGSRGLDYEVEQGIHASFDNCEIRSLVVMTNALAMQL
ncbi:hypothetical protein ACKKBF_B35155 [Auxenochlorella protothecoides x Auxenochlorella symbiontica]